MSDARSPSRAPLWWPLLSLVPFPILLAGGWSLRAAAPLVVIRPCGSGWTAPWDWPFLIAFAAAVAIMAVCFTVALVRGPSGARIAAWALVWIGVPLAFGTFVGWLASLAWHC